MKKILCMFVLGALLAAPTTSVEAADAGAASVLSLVLPGTGEWYNGGFKGSYPWGECIVGSICFLFRYGSMIDAAAGATDDGMRLDFWAAP